MEAAYAHAGLNFRYINVDVSEPNLHDAVRGAVAMGWRGFNCSLPHKQAIIDHLDELAPSAQIIGAVNTVLISDGTLLGENTDGRGFTSSLAEVSPIRGQVITILGSGGAARAIAVECALQGAQHIVLFNRSQTPGEELAALINARTSSTAEYLPWKERVALPSGSNVVINATSIGFGAQAGETPNVDLDSIHPDMIVADVVANPPETAWLKHAANRGATILNGVGMLINQAALNGKIWTGVDLDRKVMRQAFETVQGK